MRRRCSLLVLGLVVLAGCGPGGPATGDLIGEVSLDGQPLAEGVVRFTPVDGSTPTAASLIEGGKFTLKVPVATHRVEISSPKLPKGIKSQKEMKRGTVDEGAALEELIPEKYNSRSELKTEVKAGANTVKYELKSK